MAKKEKVYPTQEELKRLFDYDEERRVLVWKRRKETRQGWNGRWAGTDAGSIRITERPNHIACSKSVSINGESYLPRHIISIFLTGEKSPLKRSCKHQSASNFKKIEQGKYIGISKTKEGTFCVKINQRYLGKFSTAEAAAARYNDFAREEYGDEAILNPVPDIDWRMFKTSIQSANVKKRGLPTGVYRKGGKYAAECKKKYLGVFSTHEDAARAYNRAAREAYGDAAVLNDIPDPFGDGAPI